MKSTRPELKGTIIHYDAKTPTEYLKVLERDWRREKLLELRSLIKEHGPDLKENIRYGMLSYDLPSGGGIALNAQKNSVNFYVGPAKKIDPDGTLLAGLDVGKGCIRFKKSKAVADTRIEEFMKKALVMLRNGENIGC